MWQAVELELYNLPVRALTYVHTTASFNMLIIITQRAIFLHFLPVRYYLLLDCKLIQNGRDKDDEILEGR